jgi:hypothetical protein
MGREPAGARRGERHVGNLARLAKLEVLQPHRDDQLDEEIAPRIRRGRQHERARAVLEAAAERVGKHALERVAHLDLEEALLLRPDEEQRLAAVKLAEARLLEGFGSEAFDAPLIGQLALEEDAELQLRALLEVAHGSPQHAVVLAVRRLVDEQDLAAGGCGDCRLEEQERGAAEGDTDGERDRARMLHRKSSAQR